MPQPKKTSTWSQASSPEYPTLSGDMMADVAIVGGGMAGIMTAYQLMRAGKRVIVLESDQVGSGATLQTSAFITQVIDTPLTELVLMLGSRKAQLIWDSGYWAIEEYMRIVAQEALDCEFMRCSAYVYARTEDEAVLLEDEAKVAQKLGFRVALGAGPMGFEQAGYLEIPGQAKFNPAKFMHSLAQKVMEGGGYIFGGSRVRTLKRVDGSCVLSIGRRTVTADQVVIATHNPFGSPKQTKFKKGMYTTYVLEAEIRPGAIREALYWDMANPYHYFRIDRIGRVDRIICGGEDHRAEIGIVSRKHFAALQEYLAQVMGQISYTVTRRWSGPILEPSDGIALIGEIEKGLYVATGFSGNGMTYSAIASRLIADGICGERNQYTSLYNPKRSLVSKGAAMKAGDYIQEFFGGILKNIFKK